MTEPRDDRPTEPTPGGSTEPTPQGATEPDAQQTTAEPAGSAAAESAPAGRSGGLRWAIALGAVAVIVAVTAAAIFLLTSGPTTSTTAGYVPEGSYLYLEARLDLPGDQRQNLANLLAHFPGFDDQAIFDQKIDEAMDRIVSQSTGGSELYTRDLKPWLGDSIALVGTRVPAMADGRDAGILGILAVKDRAAASAWIDRTARLTGKQTEPYNGVTVTTGAPAEGEMPPGVQAAYAITGDVLLAGDLDSVKAAIDTKGGSRVIDGERYRAGRAGLAGDQAAFALVDVRSVIDRLAGSPALENVPAEQLRNVPDWMAFGLRFEGDALVVQTAMDPVEGIPAATDRVSELAPHLPADTVLAGEGHAVGEYVKVFLDNLRKNEETRAALEQIEHQAALVGGLESFYSWIGDATVAVAGSGTEWRGGIVAKVVDDDVLAGRIASLRNLLALMGGGGVTLTDTPYGDGQITTIDLGESPGGGFGLPGSGSAVPSLPSGPVRLAYTHQRGLFVFGSDEQFVKDVLDAAPGSSLADQPRYRAAIERSGAANTGQWYVDLRAIVEAASAVMPESEKATFEREVLPYLRPFSAIAASGLAGEPIRSRTVVIVE